MASRRRVKASSGTPMNASTRRHASAHASACCSVIFLSKKLCGAPGYTTVSWDAPALDNASS